MELIAQATKHWSTSPASCRAALSPSGCGHPPRYRRCPGGRRALSRWPGDPDAALDAFLRQVAPGGLPAGKMELRTASLSLTAVDPHRSIQGRIEIATAVRLLRVQAFSTQAWVRLATSSFGCPPGGLSSLQVEVDPSGLAQAAPHIAAVTLEPEGGTPKWFPFSF